MRIHELGKLLGILLNMTLCINYISSWFGAQKFSGRNRQFTKILRKQMQFKIVFFSYVTFFQALLQFRYYISIVVEIRKLVQKV